MELLESLQCDILFNINLEAEILARLKAKQSQLKSPSGSTFQTNILSNNTKQVSSSNTVISNASDQRENEVIPRSTTPSIVKKPMKKGFIPPKRVNPPDHNSISVPSDPQPVKHTSPLKRTTTDEHETDVKVSPPKKMKLVVNEDNDDDAPVSSLFTNTSMNENVK